MNNRIDKERIHLMSPCATVCAALEIAPAAEERALRAAVETVLRAHALRTCRRTKEQPHISAHTPPCARRSA